MLNLDCDDKSDESKIVCGYDTEENSTVLSVSDNHANSGSQSIEEFELPSLFSDENEIIEIPMSHSESDEIEVTSINEIEDAVETYLENRQKCWNDNFFRCKSGKCISKTFVCDMKIDCDDGSDEEGCVFPECSQYQYRCDNGQCIFKRFRCDNDVDCYDGSDELGCPFVRISL